MGKNMDFLEQMANAPDPAEAEVKLDLTGLARDVALAKLDETVKHCKKMSVASLYVTFDAAKPGAGETLFQPVARYFKFEKINGYVLSAVPVMGETGGLFVKFRF